MAKTPDERPKDWPKGSYEEWVESELRAGRDPCIRVQDDREQEDADPCP